MNSTSISPQIGTVIASLFRYKAWSNAELFAALLQADAARFSQALHGAIRLLNHIYVVDSIFKAHLEGATHSYSASNTVDTPTLAELKACVEQTDDWYVQYAAALSSEALVERVPFRFTDGDAGLMTREEILMHVSLHGGYHRGAVGQMLRAMEMQPPRDLYTRYLHQSEPARRSDI
jgi:uncharacterized damage-inducible protein DinB